jgi:hypothetical protein
MPTSEINRDNSVLIGVVLAAVLAILILLGATVFKSGDRSAENTTPPSSTEAPATN